MRPESASPERLHLIFDADDTLWEANILFERAINDFIVWIGHPTLDPDSIRATLHDIEAANSVAHGYGTRVFLRSLHECFERLLLRPPTPDDQARIEALAAPLLSHAIEPIADVESTLSALGARHDLLLLTKGDEVEQQTKIDLSGLGDHFRRVVIVPEKTASVYVDLVEAERLGAVFIPNVNTWAMEHDVVDETAERLLQIDRFADLLSHF